MGLLLRLLSNRSAAPLADIFYNPAAAAVGTVEHALAPLHLRGWVPAEIPTVAQEQSTRGRQDHSSVGSHG